MGNQLKIVAIALHMSLLMYVGVLFFLMQSDPAGWEMGFRILPENKIIFFTLIGTSFASTALSIFMSQPIVRMALAESVAIYGFVAAFLNHSFLLIVPFAVWALILQIFVGPWIQKD